MSKYTTEVRFICEAAYGFEESKGYDSIADIIEAGRASIFNFEYPIFDPAYKPVLETKILKHYYTREISEETVGLWKLRLDSRMNEIMPFYNKLYESELLKFNPLWDVDYSREGTRDGSQTKEETSETSTVGSDTMKGGVYQEGVSSENSSSDGTVNESGTLTGSENKTDYANGSKKRGGTESRELQTETSESHSGTDTDTTTRDNKNDHWDYYSDTPQGTIGFIPGSTGEPQASTELENQTYLTNVRHVTDDTDGSEEVKETEHGHVVEGSSEGSDTLTLNTTETTENVGSGETAKSEATSKDTTQSTTNERTGYDSSRREYDTVNSKEGSTTGLLSGNASNFENYVERVSGKMGTVSYAKLLKEFRETFLNIDVMIINALGDLFFGLWE